MTRLVWPDRIPYQFWMKVMGCDLGSYIEIQASILKALQKEWPYSRHILCDIGDKIMEIIESAIDLTAENKLSIANWAREQGVAEEDLDEAHIEFFCVWLLHLAAYRQWDVRPLDLTSPSCFSETKDLNTPQSTVRTSNQEESGGVRKEGATLLSPLFLRAAAKKVSNESCKWSQGSLQIYHQDTRTEILDIIPLLAFKPPDSAPNCGFMNFKYDHFLNVLVEYKIIKATKEKFNMWYEDNGESLQYDMAKPGQYLSALQSWFSRDIPPHKVEPMKVYFRSSADTIEVKEEGDSDIEVVGEKRVRKPSEEIPVSTRQISYKRSKVTAESHGQEEQKGPNAIEGDDEQP